MILLDKKFKLLFFFFLNEHNVPPLSNVCHPFWSDVSGCLFQCKAASNVKHVSVHANPANTSSVSKLMKSLNISNPVPGTATKRNVCNASTVSQFIKPLNVSKSVYSKNTTKRNVHNTSSVSQVVKTFNAT